MREESKCQRVEIKGRGNKSNAKHADISKIEKVFRDKDIGMKVKLKQKEKKIDAKKC